MRRSSSRSARATLDFDRFLTLRLSEHLLHTWDIEVATDPTATLPADATSFVLDVLPMITGFVGKSDGNERVVTIHTTNPDRVVRADCRARASPSAPSSGSTTEAPRMRRRPTSSCRQRSSCGWSTGASILHIPHRAQRAPSSIVSARCSQECDRHRRSRVLPIHRRAGHRVPRRPERRARDTDRNAGRAARRARRSDARASAPIPRRW